MFCTNCGAQLDDDAVFCTNCGATINKDDTGNSNSNKTKSKYCIKCGAPMPDGTEICLKCGCKTEPKAKEPSTLSSIAKAFMIVGCVTAGLEALLPLCWAIPMTLHYYRCLKEGKPVSTAFKVCSLLFVNTVAGILMLCDND